MTIVCQSISSLYGPDIHYLAVQNFLRCSLDIDQYVHVTWALSFGHCLNLAERTAPCDSAYDCYLARQIAPSIYNGEQGSDLRVLTFFYPQKNEDTKTSET
jgi:hypothetical protein